MKPDFIKQYDLRKFPYRINWEITHQCNFSCPYCSGYETINKTHPAIYSPHDLSAFFDKTGVSWLLLISGGEPFLYPHFVDVCYNLSRNHHLQITTNLSCHEVYEFADKINPEKVFNISASYHRYERAMTESHNDFLDKCRYLQKKGFNLIVNFVAYPPLIDTVENDIGFFESEGFDTMLFGYRGLYNGKNYPYEYNEKELELLEKYAVDDTEIKIATNSLNYYGLYCEAGSHYFCINQNGDIGRCFTLPKKIGNLFESDFPMNKKPYPCIAKQCKDCYNGPASITMQKASKLNIYLEKRLYKKK